MTQIIPPRSGFRDSVYSGPGDRRSCDNGSVLAGCVSQDSIEILQPVEHDLNSDTEHEKSGQPYQDAGSGRAKELLQALGKPVAQKDRYTNQSDSKDGCESVNDQLQMALFM